MDATDDWLESNKKADRVSIEHCKDLHLPSSMGDRDRELDKEAEVVAGCSFPGSDTTAFALNSKS